MEPFGVRKLCPKEEHSSKLFAAFFLQRLPREIYMLLAHDDHSNLHQLAVKADQLLAFLRLQLHESPPVAAVAVGEDAELVAAMRFSAKGGKQKGWRGGHKGKPPMPPPPWTWRSRQTACATTAGHSERMRGIAATPAVI